jgi:hypothetical protein
MPSKEEAVASREKKEKALKELHDRLEASYEVRADKKEGKNHWKSFGMPLRIRDDESGATHLAERGELPDAHESIFPYGLWSTAAFSSTGGDFKEFGIGLGLYFKTEIVFGVLLFIMMIITSPTINYYGGMEYSNEQTGTDIMGGTVSGLNSGTAACTKQIFTWMSGKYGPQAPIDLDQSFPPTLPTYNEYWDMMGGSVRNTCLLTENQGWLDLTAACIFIVFVICFGFFIDQRIEEMDEAVQSAQDYSVVVDDPPIDSKECDEWKDYFSQFGVVAGVTIAIDNAKILAALGKEKYLRREKRLEQMYDQDSGLADVEDDENAERLVACCRATKIFAFVGDILQAVGVGRDLDWCNRELEKNKAVLEEVLKEEHTHNVKKVYVTFDTEQGQRRCLSELKVGDIPAALDKPPARWVESGVAESYKFRGEHILHVEEACEPSEIQWQNLGTSPNTLMLQQIATFIITLIMVVCAALVVRAGTYPAVMAILIAIFNCSLPEILKVVVTLESHDVFNDAQQSLLIKLLMARITLSSFVLTFIVIDFELALTNQAMSSITGVMLAEAVTTPIIHFADFSTLGKQIALGPFAKTQAKMNMLWEGSVWTLAERYTDLVKAMFTGMFFMSIVPVGLMFSCLAMFVCYWVDKFLLLRKWKQVPKIGGDLAKDSQTYLLIAVVFHFMVTTVFYSNFTYDHVCAVNVDCMKAGGYADTDVSNCYVPDHKKLFEAYKETDLYRQHGDMALGYAKKTLEYDVLNGNYPMNLLTGELTPAGQMQLDAYTNATSNCCDTVGCTAGNALMSANIKCIEQLTYSVFGALPTTAPTVASGSPTAHPTGGPTYCPTSVSPTKSPTRFPTPFPSEVGDAVAAPWRTDDRDMSDHQFPYQIPGVHHKDEINHADAVGHAQVAWVWCDKRASDEAYEYFWGDTPGWMSKEQKTIKEVYRIITTCGVLVILFIILGIKFYNSIKKLTVGSYTPTGDCMNIDFVDCDDIQAYIPQWIQAGFPQPFTACDMHAGSVNSEYLSFECFNYDLQALCVDVPAGKDAHYPDIVGLNKERSRREKPIFSPCKLYVEEIKKSGIRSSDIEGHATGDSPIDHRPR